MMYNQISNAIYKNLCIAILLIALAIKLGANFEWLFPTAQEIKNDAEKYTMSDIRKAYPQAIFAELNNDKSVSVFNQNKKELGTALISSNFGTDAQGYGGKLSLLIALDTVHVIQQVELLQHNETQEFIEHLTDDGLLEKWNGLVADTNTFKLSSADVVSGATYSSTAVIQGVKGTLSAYLSLQQSKKVNLNRVIQLVVSFVLIVVALLMLYQKISKKYYTFHLIIVLIIMGFFYQKMFSSELFFSWLKNGLPWHQNLEMIVILILSQVLLLFGKKNFYCNYFCPMGAVQILVSKISPFKKLPVPNQIASINIQWIYFTVIWTSLVIGFSLPLADMEPFMAFSYQISGWVMIGAGIFIVILSLFINRPWCRICPTGCTLHLLSSLKTTKNEKQS